MTIKDNKGILFFRNGQQLVDETIDKIKDLEKSGKLQDGDYNFLTYLISRPELSYKDVSIITLSLFGDGLNTVSWFFIHLFLIVNFVPLEFHKINKYWLIFERDVHF